MAACYWIFLESVTYLMEKWGRRGWGVGGASRTQEWNAICLDIGEKIERKCDSSTEEIA
jgi:hypothetical protein